MEQHPVPQNVTSFQFRLIGDMTIKQFGYLAVGAVLAYVCYKLPLPFFITWPLAILFGVGGFGLAFVPVEERPMDVWVLAFFKSIYSPTQYIWQKTKPTPQLATPPNHLATLTNQVANLTTKLPVIGTMSKPKGKPLSQQAPPQPEPQSTIMPQPFIPKAKPVAFSGIVPPIMPTRSNVPDTYSTPPISTGTTSTRFPFDKPVLLTRSADDPWSKFMSFIGIKPKKEYIPTPRLPLTEPMPIFVGKQITTPNYPTEVPHATLTSSHASVTSQEVSKAQAKMNTLEETVKKLEGELQTKAASDNRIVELQKQLTEILTQRESMEKELVIMRQRLESQTAPARVAPIIPTPAIAQAPSRPSVRMVTPDDAHKVGLPKLTTFPNVVTGIIKDNLGTLLPGVLVTVRDKDDVPLRALKTNKLGQFAASTPLPDGTYIVEVEDPRSRFSFDRTQMTLTGSVMSALEITAKDQKKLNRERLSKEIFGNTQEM